MEKSVIGFSSVGEATLLVLSIPGDFAASGEEGSACFALPIVSRQGGLTLAVPVAALDAERLVDQLTVEDGSLLGPSKSFSTPLLVESEDGTVGPSGNDVRFMVVDFSDGILAYLVEYDSEKDDGNIIAYDADVPHGIPSVEGLAEKVRLWAAQENVGRVHFYSAREEQEFVEPVGKSVSSAKKPGPKKTTNAMLVEQISMLATQVQAISAQQLAVQNVLEAGVAENPNLCHSCSRARRWIGFDPEDASYFRDSQGSAEVWKLLSSRRFRRQLCRWVSPPKVRPPPPKQPSVADPFAGLAQGGEARVSRSSGSYGGGFESAVYGPDGLGGPSSFVVGPPRRFFDTWGQQCKFFYKRRAAERAASKRTCYGKQLFLHAGTAANAPTVVPVEAGASYRCRTTSGRPEHASVPREVRRIQEQSRDWSGAMAAGPHNGRNGGGGLPHSQGALGSADLLFRAECIGWQLESGVCDLPHGGAAHPSLSRPHDIPSGSRPSFFGLDSKSVGGGGPCLLERPRSAADKEERIRGEKQGKGCTDWGGGVSVGRGTPRNPRPLLAKGTNEGQR